MNKGYIYKYTFPNGKIYIGQTKTSVEQRHKQHLWYAKNGGKIKNRQLCDIAIAKYGEPKLEVIEEIIDNENKPYQFKKALDNAEIKWIKEYNSTNRNIGYNIQHGGHIANEEQYILEEIHQEKIQEQAEKIFYIRSILDSIIQKIGDDFIKIDNLNLKKIKLN